MAHLTVQFLHLLFLLLSIGSYSPNGPAQIVTARPVDRRGSTTALLGEGQTAPQTRSRKPRIGVVVANDGERFPSIQRSLDGDAQQSGAYSVSLTRLPPRSDAHPQMLLQHHLNMANAKLGQRQNRRSVTQQERTEALQRRREAILESETEAARRRRRSMAPAPAPAPEARSPSSKNRVGHAGGSSSTPPGAPPPRGERRSPEPERDLLKGHGRYGVAMDPKTGRAGKASKKRDAPSFMRDLVARFLGDGDGEGSATQQERAEAPHNLLPEQNAGTTATTSESAVEAAVSSATSGDASECSAGSSAKGAQSNKASKKKGSSSSSSKASKSKASSTSKSKQHKAAASDDATATTTYDIASLGYPTAALAASNSDDLEQADTPDTVGSLALDIEANDVGYVADFKIGAAGNFRLLIDSGSADTWVASTSCGDCSSSHKSLGKSTSSSFKAITPTKDFSITYGTGSVSGHLGNDTLVISNFTLPDHTFGLATNESSDFSDSSVPFDGLMGLAREELSSTQTPTPIDSLFSAGLVSQPVMGYHLGRSSDAHNDGEVTFGGVNGELFEGNLTEVDNVSDQGFWEANLDAVSFGGKSISLSGSTQRTAILDTGTTLIVAPQKDADAVHAAIEGSKSDGQGGYTIPCTTSGQVALSFGGKEWAMDPRDMVYLPVDSKDLKGDCVSAISAGSVGQAGEWLVGAAFLKNVYFATNTKSNTIALGVLAADTGN